MKRRFPGGQLIAAAVVLFLSAGVVGAQTSPMPILPKEPKADPTPPPTAKTTTVADPRQPRTSDTFDPATRTEAKPWEFGISLDGGYDSNIDYSSANGPSSTVFEPRGEIARNFRSRRGRLRLSSKGAWAGYPSESDLNRTYFGFGLDADYQTSEKTAWNLSGGYDKGYNDASTILTEQGVAFGLVKTEGFDAGIGLTQKVGTNTKLRIDGRFYRVEFDSPAVVDGQNIRGTVVLEKQFSARNSGGLVYSAEQILDGAGNPYLTHYGSLQWTRLFTPRTALLLEGGAGYTPDASDVGLANEYSFYGGLSYVHQVGKSTITALLRREVTPAFGYGQSLLTTRAAVRGAVPLGKDWRFEVIADFVRPDPAALAVLNFPPTTDAAVSLGRRVGRYMALSGATRYRWRGAIGATPGYSAFQIGLMFTASTEGRTVTVPGRPVGAP